MVEKIINEIKKLEYRIEHLQEWRNDLQEEVKFLRKQCMKNNIPYKRAAKKMTAKKIEGGI
tara:strand:+ start:8538 stop:8720 length:183 start_codon:yes stop_codon:yes gene_type:complete